MFVCKEGLYISINHMDNPNLDQNALHMSYLYN
jgi:hypothetical protein